MRPFAFAIPLILLMILAPPSGSAISQACYATITAQSPAQTGPPPPQTRPAQEPAQKQEDTIHLSSRLVLVPVSASDSSGHPVKDLGTEDIVIEEDGRPQQVVSLGEPGKTPLEIALLMDVSGSTQKQFVFEQQAAVQFIADVLKTSDAVSLFSIALSPQLVKARTGSREEAVAALLSIRASNELFAL